MDSDDDTGDGENPCVSEAAGGYGGKDSGDIMQTSEKSVATSDKELEEVKWQETVYCKQIARDARKALGTTVARTNAAMLDSQSTSQRMGELLTQMKAEFQDYAIKYVTYQDHLSPNDRFSSEAYFSDIEAEYHDCADSVLQWIDAGNGQPDVRHKTLCGPPEDTTTPSEVDQRIDQLAKTTQDQITSLTSQCNRMEAMLGQAIKALSEKGREPGEPVRAASTPVSGPQKGRMSFGDMSSVGSNVTLNASNVTSALNAMTDMASTLRDAMNTSKGTSSSIKGPKIKMFHFSGDTIDFLPFIKAFENIIETTTPDPAARLSALIECTSGDVKQMLQCCLMRPPDQGYSIARKMLHDQFGDEDNVVQAWLAKFGKLDCTETLTQYRNLYFQLCLVKETLTPLGKLTEFETKANLKIIIDTLDYDVQEHWRQKNTDLKLGGTSPTLQDLIDFIFRIVQEKSDTYFGCESGRPKPLLTPAKPPRPKVKAFSTVGDTESSNATFPETRVAAASSAKGNTPFRPPESRGNYEPRPANGASRALFKPTAFSCFSCGQQHTLNNCEKFRGLATKDRAKLIVEHRLCMNCFHPHHVVRKCKSAYSCRKCSGRHHTLLHSDDYVVEEYIRSQQGYSYPSAAQPASHPSPASPATSQQPSVPISHAASHANTGRKVALPIVPCMVKSLGRTIHTYALIDGGANCTMCTVRLVKQLNITPSPLTTTLTTVEQACVPLKCGLTDLHITSIDGDEIILTDVLAKESLPISATCRASAVEVMQWDHLKNLDIHFPDIEQVDILIGQDHPDLHVPRDTEPGERGKRQPYGMKTDLGWYVGGPLNNPPMDKVSCFAINEVDDQRLDDMVERFWKIHDMYDVEGVTSMSVDDQVTEKIYDDSAMLIDGHWQLDIPFKSRPIDMPNNYKQAQKRLDGLSRRLNKDPVQKEKYVQAFKKNIDTGLLERVPDSKVGLGDGKEWYLSHGGVFHPRMPKCRVICHGNIEFQGVSLSNQVYSGADYLNNLVSVLVRFRGDQVAILCDIQAMFNQVLVTPSDRGVLRVLWWEDDVVGGRSIVFENKTHIFGGVW